MAVELKYICDTCQAMKGKANRWWIVRGGPLTVTVTHFDAKSAEEKGNNLACSERCLNRSISLWCEGVASV